MTYLDNIESSWGIIHPDDNYKVSWNFIGIFFIIYQGIVLPYRICFNSPASGFAGYFEMIQDFYFMIDIILSLNTGFYNKGNIIMLRKQILLNYFKLW